MKKTLHDYLLMARKNTKITMRFAFDISEEAVEKIETFLKKYTLISMSAPKDTIFQSVALGFPEPINSKVYIIEAETSMPMTSDNLKKELCVLLGVTEKRVSVQTETEKRLVSTEVASPSSVKDVETYVGKYKQTDMVNMNFDKDEFYGAGYNEDMIKTLLDARKAVKKED